MSVVGDKKSLNLGLQNDLGIVSPEPPPLSNTDNTKNDTSTSEPSDGVEESTQLIAGKRLNAGDAAFIQQGASGGQAVSKSPRKTNVRKIIDAAEKRLGVALKKSPKSRQEQVGLSFRRLRAATKNPANTSQKVANLAQAVRAVVAELTAAFAPIRVNSALANEIDAITKSARDKIAKDQGIRLAVVEGPFVRRASNSPLSTEQKTSLTSLRLMTIAVERLKVRQPSSSIATLALNGLYGEVLLYAMKDPASATGKKSSTEDDNTIRTMLASLKESMAQPEPRSIDFAALTRIATVFKRPKPSDSSLRDQLSEAIFSIKLPMPASGAPDNWMSGMAVGLRRAVTKTAVSTGFIDRVAPAILPNINAGSAFERYGESITDKRAGLAEIPELDLSIDEPISFTDEKGNEFTLPPGLKLGYDGEAVTLIIPEGFVMGVNDKFLRVPAEMTLQIGADVDFVDMRRLTYQNPTTSDLTDVVGARLEIDRRTDTAVFDVDSINYSNANGTETLNGTGARAALDADGMGLTVEQIFLQSGGRITSVDDIALNYAGNANTSQWTGSLSNFSSTTKAGTGDGINIGTIKIDLEGDKRTGDSAVNISGTDLDARLNSQDTALKIDGGFNLRETRKDGITTTTFDVKQMVLRLPGGEVLTISDETDLTVVRGPNNIVRSMNLNGQDITYKDSLGKTRNIKDLGINALFDAQGNVTSIALSSNDLTLNNPRGGVVMRGTQQNPATITFNYAIGPDGVNRPTGTSVVIPQGGSVVWTDVGKTFSVDNTNSLTPATIDATYGPNNALKVLEFNTPNFNIKDPRGNTVEATGAKGSILWNDDGSMDRMQLSAKSFEQTSQGAPGQPASIMSATDFEGSWNFENGIVRGLNVGAGNTTLTRGLQTTQIVNGKADITWDKNGNLESLSGKATEVIWNDPKGGSRFSATDSKVDIRATDGLLTQVSARTGRFTLVGPDGLPTTGTNVELTFDYIDGKPSSIVGHADSLYRANGESALAVNNGDMRATYGLDGALKGLRFSVGDSPHGEGLVHQQPPGIIYSGPIGGDPNAFLRFNTGEMNWNIADDGAQVLSVNNWTGGTAQIGDNNFGIENIERIELRTTAEGQFQSLDFASPGHITKRNRVTGEGFDIVGITGSAGTRGDGGTTASLRIDGAEMVFGNITGNAQGSSLKLDDTAIRLKIGAASFGDRRGKYGVDGGVKIEGLLAEVKNLSSDSGEPIGVQGTLSVNELTVRSNTAQLKVTGDDGKGNATLFVSSTQTDSGQSLQAIASGDAAVTFWRKPTIEGETQDEAAVKATIGAERLALTIDSPTGGEGSTLNLSGTKVHAKAKLPSGLGGGSFSASSGNFDVSLTPKGIALTKIQDTKLLVALPGGESVDLNIADITNQLVSMGKTVNGASLVLKPAEGTGNINATLIIDVGGAALTMKFDNLGALETSVNQYVNSVVFRAKNPTGQREVHTTIGDMIHAWGKEVVIVARYQPFQVSKFFNDLPRLLDTDGERLVPGVRLNAADRTITLGPQSDPDAKFGGSATMSVRVPINRSRIFGPQSERWIEDDRNDNVEYAFRVGVGGFYRTDEGVKHSVNISLGLSDASKGTLTVEKGNFEYGGMPTGYAGTGFIATRYEREDEDGVLGVTLAAAQDLMGKKLAEMSPENFNAPVGNVVTARADYLDKRTGLVVKGGVSAYGSGNADEDQGFSSAALHGGVSKALGPKLDPLGNGAPAPASVRSKPLKGSKAMPKGLDVTPLSSGTATPLRIDALVQEAQLKAGTPETAPKPAILTPRSRQIIDPALLRKVEPQFADDDDFDDDFADFAAPLPTPLELRITELLKGPPKKLNTALRQLAYAGTLPTLFERISLSAVRQRLFTKTLSVVTDPIVIAQLGMAAYKESSIETGAWIKVRMHEKGNEARALRSALLALGRLRALSNDIIIDDDDDTGYDYEAQKAFRAQVRGPYGAAVLRAALKGGFTEEVTQALGSMFWNKNRKGVLDILKTDATAYLQGDSTGTAFKFIAERAIDAIGGTGDDLIAGWLAYHEPADRLQLLASLSPETVSRFTELVHDDSMHKTGWLLAEQNRSALLGLAQNPLVRMQAHAETVPNSTVPKARIEAAIIIQQLRNEGAALLRLAPDAVRDLERQGTKAKTLKYLRAAKDTLNKRRKTERVGSELELRADGSIRLYNASRTLSSANILARTELIRAQMAANNLHLEGNWPIQTLLKDPGARRGAINFFEYLRRQPGFMRRRGLAGIRLGTQNDIGAYELYDTPQNSVGTIGLLEVDAPTLFRAFGSVNPKDVRKAEAIVDATILEAQKRSSVSLNLTAGVMGDAKGQNYGGLNYTTKGGVGIGVNVTEALDPAVVVDKRQVSTDGRTSSGARVSASAGVSPVLAEAYISRMVTESLAVYTSAGLTGTGLGLEAGAAYQKQLLSTNKTLGLIRFGKTKLRIAVSALNDGIGKLRLQQNFNFGNGGDDKNYWFFDFGFNPAFVPNPLDWHVGKAWERDDPDVSPFEFGVGPGSIRFGSADGWMTYLMWYPPWIMLERGPLADFRDAKDLLGHNPDIGGPEPRTGSNLPGPVVDSLFTTFMAEEGIAVKQRMIKAWNTKYGLTQELTELTQKYFNPPRKLEPKEQVELQEVVQTWSRRREAEVFIDEYLGRHNMRPNVEDQLPAMFKKWDKKKRDFKDVPANIQKQFRYMVQRSENWKLFSIKFAANVRSKKDTLNEVWNGVSGKIASAHPQAEQIHAAMKPLKEPNAPKLAAHLDTNIASLNAAIARVAALKIPLEALGKNDDRDGVDKMLKQTHTEIDKRLEILGNQLESLKELKQELSEEDEDGFSKDSSDFAYIDDKRMDVLEEIAEAAKIIVRGNSRLEERVGDVISFYPEVEKPLGRALQEVRYSADFAVLLRDIEVITAKPLEKGAAVPTPGGTIRAQNTHVTETD